MFGKDMIILLLLNFITALDTSVFVLLFVLLVDCI